MAVPATVSPVCVWVMSWVWVIVCACGGRLVVVMVVVGVPPMVFRALVPAPMGERSV